MVLRSRSFNIRVSLTAVLLNQAEQVSIRSGEHLVHHAEVVGRVVGSVLLVDIGMFEKPPHVSSSAL